MSFMPSNSLHGPAAFLQSDAASARGSLQLLDAITAQDPAAAKPDPALGSPTALPHGFLEELAAKQDTDSLGRIMGPVGEYGINV